MFKRILSICFAENDEFHILHIIPSQEPEVISGLGGISGMDAIVTAKPDPAADKQHVGLPHCIKVPYSIIASGSQKISPDLGYSQLPH